MSVKKTDISQIKKYLAGELDAKAMHQLERRAQDDPFLQDALDGFETKGFDQPGLDMLSGRLQDRVNKKEARVIPWRTISIAASILIVIGLGGVWLFKGKPVEKERVAANLTPPAKSTADTVASKTIEQVDTIKQAVATNKQVTTADAAKTSPSPTIQPTKPAESLPASQPTQYQAAAAPRPVRKANDILKPSLPEKETSSHLAEVVVVPGSSANGQSNNYGYNAGNAAKKDSSTNALSDMIMSGYVANKVKKDSADKMALTSAATREKNDSTYLHNLVAKVNGANITPPGGVMRYGRPAQIINGVIVQGDNGKRNDRPSGLPPGYEPSDADGNLVRSAGYRTTKAKRIKKSIKDSLSMEAVALSPVIYNEDKSKNTIDSLNARPANGWKALTDYLNANATSADNKTGLLKISFIVEANGLLDNFRIIYSLTPANDQKVVNLLLNGPSWMPNVYRKPETVTITVRVR